jgi:hypothetical protein
MDGIACFEREGAGEAPAVARRLSIERLARGGEERQLVCAACGHLITTRAEAIAVAGRHEHIETNPAGFVYHFGCFARAPGCRPDGVPSKQATWFAGYFWYVQRCGACGEHLGWLFFADASEFYGLVLARLVERDADTR